MMAGYRCLWCGESQHILTVKELKQSMNEHLKNCQSHPMRGLELKYKALRDCLVNMMGTDDVNELKHILETFVFAATECKNISPFIKARIEAAKLLLRTHDDEGNV